MSDLSDNPAGVRNVSNIPRAGKIGGDDPQSVAVRTHQHYRDDTQLGNGVKTVFFLKKTPANDAQLQVFVSGLLKQPGLPSVPNDYSVSANKVTFTAPPANLAPISFLMVSS